jgi:hypothetical protein
MQAAGIKGKPKRLLADAGYFSEGNVEAVTDAGIDPLIADPEGPDTGAADDPQTAHEEGQRGLRPAQSHSGTRVRADEDCPRRRPTTYARPRQRPGEWTLQAFCHNVRKLRNSGFHWIPAGAFT